MTTLAAITFLAPAMLAGGVLLAGFPVIAHLLNRRSRRRVVFPSIRLLRESSANQSSIFRIRRLLLLAVRCAAIALLAAAFAQPFWKDAYAGSDAKRSTTVILLDASASTARVDANGTSAFERLRARAASVVERLAGGRDSAEVVVATASPRGLAGQATPNLGLVVELLEGVTASEERADLGEALALAGRTLSDGEGEPRLVILTDGQASNWMDVVERTAGDAPDGRAIELPVGTRIEVDGPTGAGATNVGVEARGAAPARAASLQPIAARVRVAAGESAAAEIPLRVLVDGRPVETRTLTRRAGEPTDDAFAVAIAERGPHEIVVEAPPDVLTIDDRAYFAVQIGERQPVTVVTDEDVGDPTGSAYYLVRALAPHGTADAGDGESDRFAPRVLSSVDLDDAHIAGVPVLFVADVVRLSDAAVRALREHLERGGVVVWFCGGGALGENLALLEEAMPELLPFVPGAVRTRTAGEPGARLTPGNVRTGLLAAFDEAAFAGLGQVLMRRSRECGRIRPDALAILTYDDGSPALTLRRYGDGTFALANFAAAPRYGDLGRHGAFVALVQSLAGELAARADSTREPRVGEPLTIAWEGDDAASAAAAITVRGPDGKPVDGAVVVRGRTGSSVSIPRTDHAGVYTVTNGGRPIASRAVNVDPRESDLRELSAESIAGLLAAGEGHGLAASAAAPNLGARAGGDTLGLWWICVLGVMAAMALEFAVLSRWPQ